MKRLQPSLTPLNHLSYRGSLLRARSELGFFREATRINRYSEELFQIRVGERSEEVKELCIDKFDLNQDNAKRNVHVLVTSNYAFNVTTFTCGQSQEEKLVLNLGDSIPGGGGKGTQLRTFGSGNLALFLPAWDSLFIFGPYGGRCDTIRLGKNASAFSPRRPRAHETRMFNGVNPNQLIFCGTHSLRILENDELLTIDLPVSAPCEIRHFGDNQFLVENSSDSSLSLLERVSQGEWIWKPIEVENKHTNEQRQWSSDKVAWSPSSYLQMIDRIRSSQKQSGRHPCTTPSFSCDVLVSPRSNSVVFDSWTHSKSLLASASSQSRILETIDLNTRDVRTIRMLGDSENDPFKLVSIEVAGKIVYVLAKEGDHGYKIRAFDTEAETLTKGLSEWRKMWGLPDPNGPKWGIQSELRGESKESKTPPKASNPKHGKVDDEFHAGGNTFAGGTGGSDTAGLGGRGGPYRLDKGHKVHQISDELKRQVDQEVLDKARELGKLAWEERLKEIRMDPRAHEAYMEARSRVQADLERLKAVMESSAIARKERHWERNQSFGELDDSRLVDGLAGEKHIFKRRMRKVPPPGSPSSVTNVRIVVDISASMYRFQSLDGRLQRMIDTTLMLLEAMHGLEHRFRVSLAGHSGESPCVPLVDWDQMPENEGEVHRVLETMAAHAQYCISGDHTVEAVFDAVENILDEDPEGGGLVIVVSDANLRRYGVAPKELATAMTASDLVNAHVVFVASVQDEAEMLVRELPFGRAKVCLETSDLPHVMRDILAEASNRLS